MSVAVLAYAMRGIDPKQVVSLTLPTAGVGIAPGGASVVFPDYSGIAQVAAAMREGRLPEYAASPLTCCLGGTQMAPGLSRGPSWVNSASAPRGVRVERHRPRVRDGQRAGRLRRRDGAGPVGPGMAGMRRDPALTDPARARAGTARVRALAGWSLNFPSHAGRMRLCVIRIRRPCFPIYGPGRSLT